MIEEIQSVKNIPGFYPNLLFQPLYEASIRAGKERGGNAAGIDADGPLTGTFRTISGEVVSFLTNFSCSVDRSLEQF